MRLTEHFQNLITSYEKSSQDLSHPQQFQLPKYFLIVLI